MIERRHGKAGIAGRCLPEVCPAVGSEPPAGHSGNGVLKSSDASGYRNNSSGGLNNMGGNGYCWSYASNSQANARNLNFNSGNVNPLNNNNRANGFSVRPCQAFGNSASPATVTATGALLFFIDITIRYTYEQLHDLVTRAYLKARQEERSKCSQLEFEVNQEELVNGITASLYTMTWKPGPLKWFVLTFPTTREVFAPYFRDRVVSHVIFAILCPVFERYFIFDSCSCRVGKGTLAGIERFEHHIRSVTDNYRQQAYCLNIDISGYFMSIVRERLYDIIWRTLGQYRRRYPEYTDYGLADYIIRAFLFRDPLERCVYVGDPALKDIVPEGKSLFDKEPGVGIPIGDVINQLFSNIYLNPFDQFVKRMLRIRNYVRYVDDGRALHRSHIYLEECRDRCGEFLDKELSLTLHPRKTTITDLNDTNYFLGAAVLPYRRYASDETMERFTDFIKALEANLAKGAPVDMEAALASLNSRLGYLQHFDEKKAIRKAIIAAPTVNQYFMFMPRYTKAKFKTQ